MFNMVTTVANGSKLDPFATVVDYCDYRLAETTANQTANGLHHITHIKSQIEGLQPTLEPLDRFESVKLLSLLITVTSSLKELDK